MANAIDKHSATHPGTSVRSWSPAEGFTEEIIPNNGADNILDPDGVAVVSKGLYVVTGGDIEAVFLDGSTRVIPSVPSGTTQLPARVKRIRAAATTALGIHAWI